MLRELHELHPKLLNDLQKKNFHQDGTCTTIWFLITVSQRFLVLQVHGHESTVVFYVYGLDTSKRALDLCRTCIGYRQLRYLTCTYTETIIDLRIKMLTCQQCPLSESPNNHMLGSGDHGVMHGFNYI